jgi:putative membrane protein
VTQPTADPSAANPSALGAPAGDTAPPLRRLHPMTPLVKGVKVFGVLAAVVSYQSYQTIQQVGILAALAGLAFVVVGAFVVSWLSWRFTGFRVTERQLVVVEGVLARRTRTVPLERVQAVDVVRPLLARLLGLAEVRLEVVGSSDTEAPLAYLTRPEAREVRDQLLVKVVDARAAAGHADGAAGPTPAGVVSLDKTTAAVTDPAAPAVQGAEADLPGAAPRAPETVHFQVEPDRLLLSWVLTPQVLFLPVLAVPSLAFAIWEGGGFNLVGVFGALSAAVGLAQQAVRRLLTEWNFSVSSAPEGLRLRHGLLETRSQTLPQGRVQAIRIRRPLLWRPFGWVRVDLDVAGYAAGSSDKGYAGVLLPVAEPDQAWEVLARVLPGVDVRAMNAPPTLVPVPRRARWRAPVAARWLAAGLGDLAVLLRSGHLTEVTTVVPYARLQSVRTSQGPWQRRLRLATVYVDTGGRRLSPTALHQDEQAAGRLAVALAAEALRHAPPAPQRTTDRAADQPAAPAPPGSVDPPVLP